MAFIIAYKIKYEFAVSFACCVHNCFLLPYFHFLAYLFKLYVAALRQGLALPLQERRPLCFVCHRLYLKNGHLLYNTLQTFTVYPGRHLS